jgi:malonyl-CoA O-methyltransferase
MVTETTMEKRTVSSLEGYAAWSKDYDAYENPLIAVEEAPLRHMCGQVRGKRVLDLGCGTGRHTTWLADQGADVIGVDESEAMLAVAREKRPQLDLRQRSLLGPLDELGQFDLVVNALVAEHIESLPALVSAIAARLRPAHAGGGQVVLSAWHPFMLLLGVPTHYEDDAANIEYVLPSHVHLISDYLRAFAASGLTVCEVAEPVCNDALIERMPHVRKHRGRPLALLLHARW